MSNWKYIFIGLREFGCRRILTCQSTKNAPMYFLISMVVIFSGCEGMPGPTQYSDIQYAGSGYDRFHYVVRARNYTLDLADRIRGLADSSIPSIVAEAETAAQGLNSAMATFNETPDAHLRIEQALVTAARAARAAYDIAESYGLNPPDVPNVPYFSQTFSDVHKTP